MQIIRSLNEWKSIRKSLQSDSLSVGFVPTMGALHEGHLSLIKNSKRENDITLVSIFVNPTQFNDPADYEKYPVTWESDINLLEQEKVDYLLAPEFKDLYKDNYRYKIVESQLSHVLCGAHRPGHFDGVLTVVMKLLNLAKADRAYFGEKDYQQMLLIKDMADTFFIDTVIVACPVKREFDGLAMSSRNLRLNEQERKLAPDIYKLISSDLTKEQITQELTKRGFSVDYVEELWSRRFVAAQLGSVRLIDNVSL